MVIALNDELRLAIEQSGDKPIELTDQQNRRFVLLSADEYEGLIRQSQNEVIDPSFYEAGEFTAETK